MMLNRQCAGRALFAKPSTRLALTRVYAVPANGDRPAGARRRRPVVNPTLKDVAGLKVGSLVEGVVESLQPFGAFVQVAVDETTVKGLIPMTEISASPVEKANEVFTVGDKVKAVVHQMDYGRGRLTLSTKKLEQTAGDMLRDRQAVYDKAEAFHASVPNIYNTLKVGDVVEGVVKRLQPYGAFVALNDWDGLTFLLHANELSSEAVADVSSVLKIGDAVKAMVCSNDPVEGRISLSTKHLEVTPGDMVRDPQLVYSKAEETAKAFLAAAVVSSA